MVFVRYVRNPQLAQATKCQKVWDLSIGCLVVTVNRHETYVIVCILESVQSVRNPLFDPVQNVRQYGTFKRDTCLQP